MNIKVVIGSGFGDEGKGLFTDYFSSLYSNSTVIRFNGGAQAGHTVTTESQRHVFGHIGSNSFLPNARTVLSRFFVVNPLLFKREITSFQKKYQLPIIDVHQDCLVTTPYDMIINQALEKQRSEQKHGSCGVGFGQTIERNQIVSLLFKDLYKNLRLKEKLFDIGQYFWRQIERLQLSNFIPEVFKINEQSIIQAFLEDCLFFQHHVNLVSNEFEHASEYIIMEGAQGLLLDQDYGVFPYMTRSNTGLKNVVTILNNQHVDLEILYATRCYTTRHGAGPLNHEISKPFDGIVDLTNQPNDYQGHLRFSYLDVDQFQNAVLHDLKYLKFDCPINIGISCLDQVPIQLPVFHQEKEILIDKYDLKNLLKMQSKQIVYESFGPTRSTIKAY